MGLLAGTRVDILTTSSDSTLGAKLVEDLQLGDMLWIGKHEVAKVISIIATKVSTLHKLTLPNKRIVYCGEDQKFIVQTSDTEQRGTPINSIKKYQLLVSYNGVVQPVRENYKFEQEGHRIASKNNCTWAAVCGGINNQATVYCIGLESSSQYFMINSYYRNGRFIGGVYTSCI